MKNLGMLIIILALMMLNSCKLKADNELIKEEKVLIAKPFSKLVIIDEKVNHEVVNADKKYTTISKNFDFLIKPAEISINQENFKIITYSFEIYNKTDKTFSDFEAIMRLDDKMEKFIQSGTTAFPPMRIELMSKNQAIKHNGLWGLLMEQSSVLFNEIELEKFSQYENELAQVAQKMQIQLNWKGGGEYFEFVVGINDETI